MPVLTCINTGLLTDALFKYMTSNSDKHTQNTDRQVQAAGLLNTTSTDKQLRARVKLLGNLLGNVLLSVAGANVYDAVEKLRKGFIDLHKKEDPVKRQYLMALIESLDEDTLSQVVRAFSTYFSLVNVAEEASQLQLRRRQMRSEMDLWRGSFDSALKDFKAMGMSAERLQTLLDRLTYIPVITAHPTEAKPRTILHALRRIFLTNEKLNDTRLGKHSANWLFTNWKPRSRYSGALMKYVPSVHRYAMKSTTVCIISKKACFRLCQWFTVIWKPSYANITRMMPFAYPAFYSSAPGLAVTAMVTPM